MEQLRSPLHTPLCEVPKWCHAQQLLEALGEGRTAHPGRYLYCQYYPCLTRFEAQPFLAEALQFFAGSSPRCIIDITSVILAAGRGPDAVIAPQKVAFGDLFGLRFIAHAIGHSDRKARIERAFHYIENNFLVGRTFTDWNDINTQAQQWCDAVANARLKRA